MKTVVAVGPANTLLWLAGEHASGGWSQNFKLIADVKTDTLKDAASTIEREQPDIAILLYEFEDGGGWQIPRLLTERTRSRVKFIAWECDWGDETSPAVQQFKSAGVSEGARLPDHDELFVKIVKMINVD